MTDIINPYTKQPYGQPIAPPAPVSGQERTPTDYRPAPGRVTVLRQEADQHWNAGLGIVKADMTLEVERVFKIQATVARVGDQVPGGIEPWFKTGDVVTIEPSMFREVELSADLSVWLGPFAAVTGVFEYE